MRYIELLETSAEQAERLERARKLGFDTEHVFYHATTQDIDAFDLRYAGFSNTVGQNEPAIFLTNHIGTANSYIPTEYYAEYRNGWTKETYEAAEKQLHTLWGKADKPLRHDGGPVADQLKARREAKRQADELADQMRQAREAAIHHSSGSNIMPLFIKTKRLMVVDMAGASYNPDTVQRYLRQAKRRKKDGVAFLNYYDWGGAPGTLSRPQTTVAMFDPKNIRSIYANFDPVKADSAELMA